MASTLCSKPSRSTAKSSCVLQSRRPKSRRKRRYVRTRAATLPSDWGAPMPIHAAACDTAGHFTQYVYNFCQSRQKRNVFPIKGASWSKRGDPIWPVPEARTLKSQSRRIRHIQAPTFKPVVVAVDTAKDMLREMLLKDEAGPGYFTFPLAGRPVGWIK